MASIAHIAGIKGTMRETVRKEGSNFRIWLGKTRREISTGYVLGSRACVYTAPDYSDANKIHGKGWPRSRCYLRVRGDRISHVAYTAGDLLVVLLLSLMFRSIRNSIWSWTSSYHIYKHTVCISRTPRWETLIHRDNDGFIKLISRRLDPWSIIISNRNWRSWNFALFQKVDMIGND